MEKSVINIGTFRLIIEWSKLDGNHHGKNSETLTNQIGFVNMDQRRQGAYPGGVRIGFRIYFYGRTGACRCFGIYGGHVK